MPRKTKTLNHVPVEATVHKKDKRANIPTQELHDFVKDDEKKPKMILYPRDPSLDPQLVWKGKDEQDSKDLAVPAVPIYIQEKISPQALIENLRREKGRQQEEPGLFDNFNGIEFEKLVEFYQHEQNWSNRMILGDSLLVMNSMAEKEGLKGKVQMIYMDPPYGIKFGSNWQVSTRKRDVKDGKAEDATREPEQIKAFRDTWEFGIHSYLAYLRDRLTVTRELLAESGSIFMQIGDENVHLVRNLLDEVFGSENFCAVVTFTKATAQSSELLSSASDYLLWYAKNKTGVKSRSLYWPKQAGAIGATNYVNVESPDGKTWKPLTASEKQDPTQISEGWRLFSADNLMGTRPATEGDLGAYKFEGKVYNGDKRKCWKTDKAGLDSLAVAKRLIVIGDGIYYKRYLDDFPVYPMTTNWIDTASSFMTDKIYVVQTTIKVIQRCILMTTDPGDLVIDPTCGGGTTAYVAEQWGRRWITCDTSRVALALARTRLMAAKFPYYLLADSFEGMCKEAEVTGRMNPSPCPAPQSSGDGDTASGRGRPLPNPLLALTQPSPKGRGEGERGNRGGETSGDIKKGFVYKRVPHVTLKSIANNPDIKEGMSRETIDAAIARYADVELLYDQPHEDNKRIRVSGPFTVESLSPHRVLPMDGNGEKIKKPAAAGAGQFELMIIENLKKAGVQNTLKKERLVFDRLEPFSGIYLHAVGEYTENGKSKRVAVCIGPEHGTVDPDLIKESAKEAVMGAGFDLLVVCGFAFDPHVSEEAKEFGKLKVLMAKMNPDLAMGDELLKKTGSGNLFMVFGEPDIEIKKQKDGKLTAEIKGLDVYDPTTGQIRSHSTDDIACWFIDTDYNAESFFVRQAYFCGADKPYERLKKALRAEINENAWESLYTTKSRPFDPPKTKKIAVKVINHYGDEVLKVYKIEK